MSKYLFELFLVVVVIAIVALTFILTTADDPVQVQPALPAGRQWIQLECVAPDYAILYDHVYTGDLQTEIPMRLNADQSEVFCQ